ncbi:hypothetical protein Psed_6892 (plasmid) [Pseudonocardia dioxanivorans CB1190]|uniref:Uncharacterized protein n=1 Tax=Pseudonocardia dioxanivorans (strain ATCC 55486 / DSM 44775 / JCM 13855 / CB1190) TaxID=675635 RepID=F2L6Y7_PSEUX|nr:hypothetical protein [Pseudonocardia dioxanivorans]AEA28960.1 hypothetical protein Psed_6892 [Pseudonocardia dioxanivorans CB1190]
MTETAEVPVLGLGRDQTQLWTQALMGLAGVVRQRRLELGRRAWNRGEDAARGHDQLAAAADPPVRTMTDQERAQFERRMRGQEPWGAGEPERRDGVTADGAVSVMFGPADPFGAWGLEAVARPVGGHDPVRTVVRCADEATARALADDLMAGGPEKVARLHGFAGLAADRARAAQQEGIDTEQQRLARAAAAVREIWPASLADAVLEPTAAQRRTGQTFNPAFGALAWRLAQMETHGVSMTTVLAEVGVARLMEPDVHNPAALAAHLVEQMLPNDEPIDLDLRAQAEHRAARSAAGPLRPDGARPLHAQAIEEALNEALPDDVLAKVQRARGYDKLLDGINAQIDNGRAVDGLLARLPVGRIRNAVDPASYLAAIVRQRGNLTERPPVAGGRASMAAVVEESLPRATAEKVVGCSGWPRLAKRLADWQNEGVPVSELIGSLPTMQVDSARRPAAFVTALLTSRVQSYRATPRDDTAGVTDKRPPSRAPAGQPDREGEPALRQTADDSPHEAEASVDLGWTEQLDESSAVDRVGLDAAVGLGTVEQDARLAARLGRAPAASAGHGAAAAVAEARAHRDEVLAGHARVTPDVTDTREREDLQGQADAHVLDQEAAAERATAAEQHGAQVAAALRAEVAYVPEATAITTRTTAARGVVTAPRRPRPRTHEQDRSRSR